MELYAADVPAMRRLGATLATSILSIEGAFVIALHGELGAGKTTLVGAMLSALGFEGHVKSPTYTLIEPYELKGRRLYHLDLYRLIDPTEVEPLGLRDLLDANSVLMIEWPERGAGALPPIDLTISLRYDAATGRRITLEPLSERGRDALLALTAAAKP